MTEKRSEKFLRETFKNELLLNPEVQEAMIVLKMRGKSDIEAQDILIAKWIKIDQSSKPERLTQYLSELKEEYGKS
ncbi:MAG: hypothetical protein ACLPY5_02630 [Candidatus Bathyarchaeia archaeon]